MNHELIVGKPIIMRQPQNEEYLRDLQIITDRGTLPQQDYSCEDYTNVRVIFDLHKEALLEYIDEYNDEYIKLA